MLHLRISRFFCGVLTLSPDPSPTCRQRRSSSSKRSVWFLRSFFSSVRRLTKPVSSAFCLSSRSVSVLEELEEPPASRDALWGKQDKQSQPRVKLSRCCLVNADANSWFWLETSSEWVFLLFTFLYLSRNMRRRRENKNETVCWPQGRRVDQGTAAAGWWPHRDWTGPRTTPHCPPLQ